MTARRFVVVVFVVAGCHRPAAPPPRLVEVPVPTLPVERPWIATVAAVRTAVDSGRFAGADSILAAFERTQTGTPDANESAFWRAMLRADPRNPIFAPADARAALESYLSGDGAGHRNEALMMLRVLSLSDSLRIVVAAQRSATETRDKARDDEMQKLRDELQKTQAELDRIKRRLGSPKP